jgi:hypothetical protein
MLIQQMPPSRGTGRPGESTDARPHDLEGARWAAVQARQLPIIRRLLQAGANPDRRDSARGRSARDYAKLDTRSGAAILQLMDTVKGRTARPVAGPKI